MGFRAAFNFEKVCILSCFKPLLVCSDADSDKILVAFKMGIKRREGNFEGKLPL